MSVIDLPKRQNANQSAVLKAGFDSLLAGTIMCLVLSLAALAARVYVRKRMLNLFGAEDWTMVATLVPFLAYICLFTVGCVLGPSVLAGGLSDKLRFYSRVAHAGTGFYVLTLMGIKLSVGLCCLRIFQYRTVEIATIYTLFAFNIAAGLTYYVYTVFTCALFRDLAFLGGFCPAQRGADISNTVFSAVSILTDIAFVILAVSCMIGSKLPRITRVVACLILALGSVGGVASAIRLSLVLQPTDGERWKAQSISTARWIGIEVATGMVAANLALTRPLLTVAIDRLRIFATKVTGVRFTPPTVPPAKPYLDASTWTQGHVLTGDHRESLGYIEKHISLSVGDDSFREPSVQDSKHAFGDVKAL
ncbi:hypothetical protein CAC42_6965 [Sphaceloma murrayae]|uniref:Rhodopsin domain-containing protein n=1 Tax=Sphaceloma murrayae TaxID=2082308 RepID=A0A2K1QQG4_9PEZI|nr:hypothetical protein CAC42_6965 [Sphaceloma murrayae]